MLQPTDVSADLSMYKMARIGVMVYMSKLGDLLSLIAEQEDGKLRVFRKASRKVTGKVSKAGGKRKVSAAGRAKIAAAQKARWAAFRKAQVAGKRHRKG